MRPRSEDNTFSQLLFSFQKVTFPSRPGSAHKVLTNNMIESKDKTPPITNGKKPGPGLITGPIPNFNPPQENPRPINNQKMQLTISLFFV